MVDNSLHAALQQLLKTTPVDFHRYLFNTLPNARLIGITGPRGVGKSTLVLQKLKESDKNHLYVDAVHIEKA